MQSQKRLRRSQVPKAEIEQIRVSQLRPYPRNARVHSKKQVKQIADSIARFGFTAPVLVDGQNMILAGHGRVEAAKLLQMQRVPCRRIESMTEAEKRAYVVADNKLTLNGTWDEQILAEELQGLLAQEIDFDVGVTGFSISEIDTLVDGIAPTESGDPRDDAIPKHPPTRCQLGDVWTLGRHRLICGNALDTAVVAALMNGSLAEMVFADPPFNVPIDGHVGGKGKVKHREFAMASGEMSSTEFTTFLGEAFQRCAEASSDGSIHYYCMDWRHMTEILSAGQSVFGDPKQLVIWAKDNGGMGSFYRSRHELIFVFKNGDAPHINAFELGQHGRYRTNVWSYKAANSFGADRLRDLALHPTVKPVQMIADAIKDVSERNAIVLDVFGGSGSTLIAAHKTGRRGYLCEIDPIYCDRIIARWEAYAKDEAELAHRSAPKRRKRR